MKKKINYMLGLLVIVMALVGVGLVEEKPIWSLITITVNGAFALWLSHTKRLGGEN